MAMKGTDGTSSPAKIEWGGFPTIFNGAKNVLTHTTYFL